MATKCIPISHLLLLNSHTNIGMTSSKGSQADLYHKNHYIQTGKAGASHETRNWENLNHDLLVVILSKLEMHDLVNSASKVCSTWRAAAKEPDCWCDILDINKPKLLRDIADCGTLNKFWHWLCCMYKGSREHSRMVDIIIRKKA